MPEFTTADYDRALEMPIVELTHLARGARALESMGADDPRAMEIFMDCCCAAGIMENRIARDGRKEIFRPDSTTDAFMAALYARMQAAELLG